MLKQKIITIIGASGFVGSELTKELAQAGYRIRAISRDMEAAAHLKTLGDVGQIQPIYGDVLKPETLKKQFNGSYAVINLVGIMFESGKQNFKNIHVKAANNIAKLAKESNVKRLIHISALGIDKSKKSSKYAQSKFQGEELVLDSFNNATIIRPSVIFGTHDSFINRLASMMNLPIMPLINNGKTAFQPVHVVDVSKAILTLLNDDTTSGKIYELSGEDIFTIRDILNYISKLTEQKPIYIPLPFFIAKIMGFFMGLLPNPSLTSDQVNLLKYDNIKSDSTIGFKQLNITPTPIYMVVPHYINRFRHKQRTISSANDIARRRVKNI